ncbi:MAG TPA: cytochrome C oxidase subunit IV family protein [Planctomycetota bacterium]|nr:cytochrome C oxidase subunit IV family protein [Planctomycetota bacterium]
MTGAVSTPTTFAAWLKTGAARKYLGIFGWLIVLTAAEVGATQLGLGKRTLAAILILTALIKASLVALYFMHLRHEVRLVLGVIVIPILIASVFVLGLFPDIVIAARAALR